MQIMKIIKFHLRIMKIIKFKEFTAKDCYEKYVSSVRDLHSFVKKVLSGGGAVREKHKKFLAK